MAMRSSGALDSDAIVVPSSHSQFGDYQANGIMKTAKRLCVNPRSFAQKVIGIMDLNASVSTFEVAGPGFINITLSNKFLEDLLTSPALIEPAEQRLRVVVDYSSPNLAKELHVGHLRKYRNRRFNVAYPRICWLRSDSPKPCRRLGVPHSVD